MLRARRPPHERAHTRDPDELSRVMGWVFEEPAARGRSPKMGKEIINVARVLEMRDSVGLRRIFGPARDGCRRTMAFIRKF